MMDAQTDLPNSADNTELQLRSRIGSSVDHHHQALDAELGTKSAAFYTEEMNDPHDPQFAGIPSLLDNRSLSNCSPPKSWGDDASSRALSLSRNFNMPRMKAKGLFSDRKGCVIVFLLVLLLFLIGLIVGVKLTSYCKKCLGKQIKWRHDYQSELSKQMQAQVSADEMKTMMKLFTKKVHPAGTTPNVDLATKIYNVWKHDNFDEVFKDEYTVQLSYADKTRPNSVSAFKSKTLKFEATSSSENIEGYFPYNAYSPNGTVKGEFVYVNYGKASDFTILRKLNISVKGRIAIARIGGGYRAGIAKRAEEAGAIGAIIYADPSNFAWNQSEVYPKGWLLPGDAPIFGNMRMSGGGGDPLTPGLPAVDGIHRWENNPRYRFPTIPIQSVGYDDAKKILDLLLDNPVPAKWNQTIAKHIGPTTEVTLQIETNNQKVNRKISNVVAVLRGKVEPDRVVVVGNHFDAWLYGASDPISGTVIMLQAAVAFSREIPRAYEPRRTLVFAAWDAEEMGTIGSTEFTERLAHRLGAQTVSYINLDCPIKGGYSFFVRSSPLLRGVILKAAASVTVNTSLGPRTVLQDWTLKLPGENGRPELPLLGGGSDQASFLFRLGVPSVYPQYIYNDRLLYNMPTYHTKYDNFDYINSELDPGFKNHAIVAKVLIDLILRLVDSAVLPFSIDEYPILMKKYTELIVKDKAKYSVLAENKIDLNLLSVAINDYKKATDNLLKKMDRLRNSSTPLALRQVNDLLMQIPRAFLWSEGLPNRPYYNNILLSPGLVNSYGASFMSGFNDGLYLGKKSGDWHHAYRQFSILLTAIRGTTLMLNGTFH